MLTFDEIANLIKPAATAMPNRIDRRSTAAQSADDNDEYVGVGIDGVLAASNKLLAVNRGEAQTDERDSQAYKRIMTTDRLVRERIRMDADHTARKLMRMLARRRTLDAYTPYHFDHYATGLLLGNPLSTPLEEINPMHIVEQQRRVTLMGPGGIGNSQAITPGMNAVHASQFGFIDPLMGPESIDRKTFVFSDLGWIPAPDVTMDHRLACNIDGRLEFRRPEKCHSYPFKGDMLGCKNKAVDFLVTPNHRIWHRDTDSRNALGRAWQMKFAEAVYGRAINIATAHEAWLGAGDTVFRGIVDHEFPMQAWCKFLSYWMADGSSFKHGRQTRITHSKMRPAYKGICDVLDFLGLDWEYRDTLNRRKGSDFPTGDFVISHPGVAEYLRRFGQAGTKYLPEYVLRQSLETRQDVWQALMETDRRINKSHTSFTSTSKRFARSVERLLISLGYSVSFREEPDTREHVKSTNWVVSKLQRTSRQTNVHGYPGWYKEPYDDLVFCVTVPGGMIYTRRGNGLGHWTGNSERAGVDTRLAWGVMIGSDGRLYQQLRNRRTGKLEWVTPEMLEGKTVKIPD